MEELGKRLLAVTNGECRMSKAQHVKLSLSKLWIALFADAHGMLVAQLRELGDMWRACMTDSLATLAAMMLGRHHQIEGARGSTDLTSDGDRLD
jgi:hypothetical protein